jgi:hypothetical protein
LLPEQKIVLSVAACLSYVNTHKKNRAIARPACNVGGPEGPPRTRHLFKQAHELVNDTVDDFVLIVVLDQRTTSLGMGIERGKITGHIIIDHA